MKKNRKSRNSNKHLYFAFDHYYGYDGEDENCLDDIKNTIKRNNVADYDMDTRNYGLFRIKDKRIMVDPKRYNKMLSLSQDIIDIINSRNGPFYRPSKIKKYDYECNVFVLKIDRIIEEWNNDFKPMMSEALSNIKSKVLTAGDDSNYMSGIIGSNSANFNAIMINMRNDEKDAAKKEMLYTSFIAQFFHLTMSRVEAMAIASITRKGWKETHFNRIKLIEFDKIKKNEVKLLEGYDKYTQSYCIWNFIKHNSMSTYNKLKEVYPEIIHNGEYKQGNLAIYWIGLTEEIMLNLIDGIKLFYINYCKLVYNEDYDRAQWDYDDHFSERVASQIESTINPLGTNSWDDFD